jgi:hypothetical protein
MSEAFGFSRELESKRHAPRAPHARERRTAQKQTLREHASAIEDAVAPHRP